jgi:hypothetical protein
MYELGSTQPPEKESIAKIKTIFRKYKLNVV